MTRQLNILLVLAAAVISFAAVDASAQLVNPGFDNISPGPGPVGNFGLVVGPPFSPGFWGAENSIITPTGAGPGGPVTPLSSPNMLEMAPSGVVTQAWQVVNVLGNLPANPSVGLSGMFNISTTTPGTTAAVRLYSFNQSSNWASWNVLQSATAQLDASAQTWEQITLAPVPVPANTEWLLAEVYYVSNDLITRGTNGFVDNVQLRIVPEPSSLALGAVALAGAVWMRRRSKR